MNALAVALNDRKFVGGLMEYQTHNGEMKYAEIGSIEIDGNKIIIHARRSCKKPLNGNLQKSTTERFVFETVEENLAASLVRCGGGPIFLCLPKKPSDGRFRLLSLYPMGHPRSIFPVAQRRGK